MNRLSIFSAAAGLTLVGAVCSAAVTTDAESAAALTFEQHIRPILKASCFQCHGEGEQLESSLDLRLVRTMLNGGEEGPAILPGRPDQSHLLELVRSGDMPKGKKKLSPDQIAIIEQWIAQGAKTARPEPERINANELTITEEERKFWAFQPIARFKPPAVKAASPIDAFIAAKLQSAGLKMSPVADRATLIRRAYFDLIGLPPSPAEIDSFVNDKSPDAWEKVIDHLLVSPHYGERWGRHWLDVAGYADSDGYSEDDIQRKYSWKYRDYVIRSFNADKPFDRFVTEQLAGDELAGGVAANLDDAKLELLTATGFLRMAPDGTGSGKVDRKIASNQVVADTIQIVSTSLLGLTVACAQCHHHRYDPISQEDYYRLRAIFEPALDPAAWRTPPQRLVSLLSAADKAKGVRIEAEAKKIDKEYLEKQKQHIDQIFEKEAAKLPADLREIARAAFELDPKKRKPDQIKLFKEHPTLNVSAGSLYLYDNKAADELKRLADKAADLRATKPVEDFVHCLTENSGKAPVTRLFHRGDPDQPKQELAPAELSILAGAAGSIALDDPKLPTTGRRLAYARHLTSGKHPLTARVIVNRIWMNHFGKGIVATPGDFGFLGERPSHPELLDWLAGDFMDHGWRIKRLHKQIMTSAAYQQSSRRTPEGDAIDPDARLLWRMPIRRLEAETVRDAILAVIGTLNETLYGKPVPVTPDENGQIVLGVDTRDTAGRPTSKVVPLGDQEFRRSIYIEQRRSRVLGMLEVFDAPSMAPNCEARSASTVAPQSLMLMNSPVVVRFAQDFADRVIKEAGPDRTAQASLAWKLAYGRSPESHQLAGAGSFLQRQSRHYAEIYKTDPPKQVDRDMKSIAPDSDRAALASFCHALISSNGFLYVD